MASTQSDGISNPAPRKHHEIPFPVAGPDGFINGVVFGMGKAGTYLARTQGGGLQLKAPGSEAPQKLADEGAYVTLIALDGAILAAWETAHGVDTKRWE